MLPSLLSEGWERLAHSWTQAEVLALFVEGPAEAGSGVEIPVATHRIIALLDATMILFQAVVEVRVAAVPHLPAQCFSDRARIGVMPVGRHLLGDLLRHFQRCREEAFGCLHIPMLAQHGVNQIAVAVDGSVEVLPLARHLDVGFVHVPGAAGLALALGAQLVGHERSEACFPLAHRLMRELETALEEHLGEVAQAEFVAHAPQDDQENDVSREFQVIEGRVSSLIELPAAGGTAKDTIAKLGCLRQFSCCRGSAIWAGHRGLSGKLIRDNRIPEKAEGAVAQTEF